MTKRLALTFPLFAASFASAAVTINFNADTLRDSGGVDVAQSTLALLVADANDNGFGALGVETINQYDVLSSGDVVVARFDFSTFLTDGVIGESLTGINLTNFSGGDELALVWLPGLDTSDTSLGGGQSYGLLSDSTWVAPADGGDSLVYQAISTSSNEFFLPNATTLSVSDLQSQASFNVVPEPSAAAVLVGAVALSFASTCRRRT